MSVFRGWTKLESAKTGRWVAGGIVLLTVVAAVQTFFVYMGSRQQVIQAEERAARLAQVVAEIQRLRDVPTFAAVGADSQRSIARRIEEALRETGLSEDRVLRIQPPNQPYRLGDSPYQVYPTRIELQNVTLSQLVDFAYALHDASKGLTVTDLRLWAPRSATGVGAERWSVEVTLTQLAFSPKTR